MEKLECKASKIDSQCFAIKQKVNDEHKKKIEKEHQRMMKNKAQKKNENVEWKIEKGRYDIWIMIDI